MASIAKDMYSSAKAPPPTVSIFPRYLMNISMRNGISLLSTLMCLVFNVKEIVKKMLEGTVTLPNKYGKSAKDSVLGYREEQLTLDGAEM